MIVYWHHRHKNTRRRRTAGRFRGRRATNENRDLIDRIGFQFTIHIGGDRWMSPTDRSIEDRFLSIVPKSHFLIGLLLKFNSPELSISYQKCIWNGSQFYGNKNSLADSICQSVEFACGRNLTPPKSEWAMNVLHHHHHRHRSTRE